MENNGVSVMDRLLLVYGLTKDTELSTLLGIARSTVGTWRMRDVVPMAECVRVATEKGVSLDWLVMGRGTAYYEDRLSESMQPSVPPNMPAIPPHNEWTRADLNILARVSGYEKLWTILQELEKQPCDVGRLQDATGIIPDLLQGYLLLLERQGLASAKGDEWQLSSNGAIVLQSRDPADVAAHAVKAADFLLNHVLPGGPDAGGTFILTEVRVPGNNAYVLLKEHIKGCLVDVDSDEGTVVRLLIGMAHEKKAG